jgi:hypothetical protein
MTDQHDEKPERVYKSYEEFRAHYYRTSKESSPETRGEVSPSFGKALAKLMMDKQRVPQA